jgi:3-phosphoshikimate 1-carboxyvinyltransferase
LVIEPAVRITGTEHRLAVASAQVKSAVLLAGLFADGPTTVQEPAQTRDHTERLLTAMGVQVETVAGCVRLAPGREPRAMDIDVAGDFSSAAFWLVLGCVHPDAELRITGVGVNPTRTGLLTILERMGAKVEIKGPGEIAGEPVADLVVWSSQLHGIEVGGDLVPLSIDELPLVALLGAFAEGETVVRDAQELRLKESDRIAVVTDGLTALGVDIQATPDGWRVRPSRLRAGRVASRGDHRMAMLFALAGALGQGAEIAGADAVAVSYPRFWTDLEQVSSGQ